MKLLNANLLWYTGLLILLVHLIPGPVFSQDRSKRKIIIGTFLPYKSQPDSSVKEKIEGELSRNFGLDGFEVRSVDSTAGTEEILSKLKSEEGSVFITGYYRKNAGVNLNLYCQIYNPETGFMIDALNVSDELEGLEGIRLPDEETKEDDSKIITKFVAKILTRIKLNSQKKERRENINEYVASSPISKDIKFNTRREDVKAEAEAVFKLLENQEVVTATRTKTKIKDAPAAVYVV
ncbi:MAG: hypothetical protein K8R21_05380 [Leptospira sp.]|nr:hypothetical protein [Leptospira sp.]